jgi:hypothetical protein
VLYVQVQHGFRSPFCRLPLITHMVCNDFIAHPALPPLPPVLQVGNPGNVKTLALWLKSWEDVHLHGKPPPQPPGGYSIPRYCACT